MTGYQIRNVPRAQAAPWLQDKQRNYGIICVLRPQSFGSLATALHFDNRRMVGVSKGSQVYFCYRAAPGYHTLMAYTDNYVTLRLQVQANRVYYVKFELRLGPEALYRVSEQTARAWFPKLRYIVTQRTGTNQPPVFRGLVPAVQ